MPLAPLPARPVVARTALHHWHAAHGAHFADRDGWRIVTHYGDAAQEAAAARDGLGLADVSAFGKFSLLGRDVSDLVRALAPDSAALKPLGVARSGLAGSSLVCRLAEDQLLWLGPWRGPDVCLELARHCEGRAIVVTDMTSAQAGFRIVGPALEAVLCRLTALDVRPAVFPSGACAETALAGVEALLVRPADEAGLRIAVAWDVAEYVWERLLEAGRAWNGTPLGLDALALLDAAAPAGQFRVTHP